MPTVGDVFHVAGVRRGCLPGGGEVRGDRREGRKAQVSRDRGGTGWARWEAGAALGGVSPPGIEPTRD